MRTIDVVRQLRSFHARQDSVETERFWNLKLSKFVNHNGAKMIDVCVWNINKPTEARTKMEVCKLRTRAAQWLSWCHQTKWGRMSRRLVLILELVYWIWDMQYVIWLFWFHARNHLFLTSKINFWIIKATSARS